MWPAEAWRTFPEAFFFTRLYQWAHFPFLLAKGVRPQILTLGAVAFDPLALIGCAHALHAQGCTSSASVNCPLLLLSHSSPPCLPPHVLWHYRSLSVEPKLLGNDDAAPGGRPAPDHSPGGHSQVDVKSPPSAGAAQCGQQVAAQPERRLLLPGQVHAR